MLIDLIRGIISGDGFDIGYILSSIAVMLLMIFLILPVHEFAHAGVAYLLGDKAIKRRGRLSLNPLNHIDIMGSLCMLLFKFGWAKAVPIDPRNFKRPKLYMGITALAGPVSNILCGMLGGAVHLVLTFFANEFLGDTFVGQFLDLFLYYYVSINATLAVFNLIPIPPLDGSKVLFVFLPDKAVEFCYRYQRYSFILIYILIFTGALNGVLNLLSGFIMKICYFFFI